MNQNTVENEKILIVDDDAVSLSLMQRILQQRYAVIATTDPLRALELVKIHADSIAVIVSDYQMPEMNGVELLARVSVIHNQIQRIMVTGHAEQHIAVDAINRSRISAFLMKPIVVDKLCYEIDAAIETYRDKKKQLRLMEQAGAADIRAKRLFTSKEQEILILLGQGFSNAEIAIQLTITVGTVKSHINNMFVKTDTNSRTKLLYTAKQLDLIDSGE